MGVLAFTAPEALYLNAQEIVTMMTIGDYPDYLAVGYLINQNMLAADDRIHLVYELLLTNATPAPLQLTAVETLDPGRQNAVIATLDGPALSSAARAAEQGHHRLAVERDFGLVLRWIYDIPGESGIPAADETLRFALEHAPDGLIGFGLGGPEIGVPREQFIPHFGAARAAGLRSVPHAGETTGPETVWTALRDLGAERIGHGTSAATDPALLAHLAETGVPLEVCPSSNIATRAVASLAEHPLSTFVDAGVVVTINSDDPSMFGTSLNQEYAIAADLLGLDEAGVTDLARTAVSASFAPDDVKGRILAEIDAHGLPGTPPGTAEECP